MALPKGFKHSDETKKKIGKASIGNKYRLGKVLSDEHKNKISLGNSGKKRTETQRKKYSLAKKGKIMVKGSQCWNWKGGISKVDKCCRDMPEYRQWRSDVFQRDNWTCRTCNKSGVYVTAHHIRGFSLIIKENKIKNRDDARKCLELWDINNGVTLCEECHKLTDNYKGKSIKSNLIINNKQSE